MCCGQQLLRMGLSQDRTRLPRAQWRKARSLPERFLKTREAMNIAMPSMADPNKIVAVGRGKRLEQNGGARKFCLARFCKGSGQRVLGRRDLFTPALTLELPTERPSKPRNVPAGTFHALAIRGQSNKIYHSSDFARLPAIRVLICYLD